MKKKTDYLATSIWYKLEITDAYQIIAEFFSTYNVSYVRKTMQQIIRSAYSDYVWAKGTPEDLLFNFEKLESVINACFIINREKKHSPIEVNSEQLFNRNLFRGWHANYTDWDEMPKFLSIKEYHDPYLGVRRFFKYKNVHEWKELLNKILHYAFSSSSILEEVANFDTLTVLDKLTRLIEATHLIDVRENTHIGGLLKNTRNR